MGEITSGVGHSGPFLRQGLLLRVYLKGQVSWGSFNFFTESFLIS